MAGIAGIFSEGRQQQVEQMLDCMQHRGSDNSKLVATANTTMGAVVPTVQQANTPPTLRNMAVWDTALPPLPNPQALAQAVRPFAIGASTSQGDFLARDPIGVRPLYYGHTTEGALCFASEVKALMLVTQEINVFPPGHWYSSESGFHNYTSFGQWPIDESPGAPTPKVPAIDRRPAEVIIADLRLRLEQAVCRRIDGDEMGSWLSGGLDSSAIVALARPHLRQLHTFAGGLPGAPDLKFARQTAAFLGTKHHEITLSLDDMLAALPQVIFALESFDAWLVRSTLVNYLVGREAGNWVKSVFSGEGGDELFAGYAYLDAIPDDKLQPELMRLLSRLHNTALQRVDRSASAHGLVPYVPMLDRDVVACVLPIPPELKRGPVGQRVEKWVLRKAVEELLPPEIVWRKKAKFWEGAGVGELMAGAAEERVSDRDFANQRLLPNGWLLKSKEELMYYRHFKEHFGMLQDLDWMGRSNSTPVKKGPVQ